MRFVIRITDTTAGANHVYYVGNGTYRVNREKYAVLTTLECEAKRYKTYNIAKRAHEMLYESCVNLGGEVEFVAVDLTHFDRHHI